MTSKLVPHNPSAVTVIRAVTPNIITLSVPFSRFGRIAVGGRGTVVRMTNGNLAVFSPTALIPEARSTIDSLGGKVLYLVALDVEHHIFLSEWAKAYPAASVMGVEGLPEKRAKNPNIQGPTFAYVWTEADKDTMKVDPDFEKDFDIEFVGAHQNKELVVNYKPDKTLITADLIFHLPPTEQYSRVPEGAAEGLLGKIFSYVFNTRGSALAQKRFLWHVACKDRNSFAASMKRINDWDFDRIIPCHGDVMETGGKDVFQKVMAWHLQK